MDTNVIREAGVLDSIQEGQNDGGTAINSGPLGRDFSGTSTHFATWGLLRLSGENCCRFCENHP